MVFIMVGQLSCSKINTLAPFPTGPVLELVGEDARGISDGHVVSTVTKDKVHYVK